MKTDFKAVLTPKKDFFDFAFAKPQTDLLEKAVPKGTDKPALPEEFKSIQAPLQGLMVPGKRGK